MSIQRYMGKRGDDDWKLVGKADGLPIPGESCSISVPNDFCEVGSPGFGSAGSFRDISLGGVGEIQYELSCQSPGSVCANGYSLHAAWISIYSAVVTIADSDSPVLGSSSGTLLGSGTNGWHKGTETAVFSASEHTGVQTTQVMIDSVQRAATNHACDFTLPTPCSNAPATTHAVTLSSVPDGSHSLQLGAIDAGGDSVLSPAQTLKTDGTAPQAPDGLSVAGGTGWQTQSAFDLTWQNPDQGQAAPIVAARWRLCPVGTIVGCVTGRQTGTDLQQLSVEPPADGEWLASIWAEDDAGNQDPARSAAVTVRRDLTAPGPPEGLAGGGTNGTNDFSVTWSNPVDSGAPVHAAWLRLCRAGSTTDCTVARSETQLGISGLSGIAVPGAGSFEARVFLEDQAGNLAEAQAAGPVTLTFDPGAPAGPGGGGAGAGGGDPLVTTPSPILKPRLVSSGLRVRSARLDRRRLTITVSGTIATTATGRVHVVYRTRRGTRLLSASGRAKVRNGRWTLRLRLGPTVARARAGRVEASVAKAPPLAAGRTSRTVALKRR